MRNLALFLTLLALVACQSGPQDSVTSAPGHGAIAVQVMPNPIVATKVSGDTYDFPFEVVVRETAGRPVTVTRIGIRVLLGGGLTLHEESWDADRIRGLGYNTTIQGRTEVRYRFNPRKEVPDDRLFGGVSAELRVDAVDDTGAATSASTSVTVRR
ncbi:MAG TPA: hypothetical protein VE974_05270 [Thermoanaerobaculia bacterium]|nr:hypothetical protein [Thermoanaerobaculia bacterium]